MWAVVMGAVMTACREQGLLCTCAAVVAVLFGLALETNCQNTVGNRHEEASAFQSMCGAWMAHDVNRCVEAVDRQQWAPRLVPVPHLKFPWPSCTHLPHI